MGIVQHLGKKIFGTQNDRYLKSLAPLVGRVNEFEPKIKILSDEALRTKTIEFRSRIKAGETLTDILPEAFAVVREAAIRTLRMRPFDVQLMGGIALHQGKVAEMRTGEGKTLVATLPSYLNALEEKGVHIITVNDYLAKRDAEWMGQIYRFLGLSVGVIVHGLSDHERQQNYGCDITYGTNNEFGFDYLRDNMKFRLEEYVQREVDSILIDEARTPLIISGPTNDSTDMYYKIDRTIQTDGFLIKDEDYTIDEKSKTASLSEVGVEKMEKRLHVPNLYDPTNIELLHHVNQALRAHVLFHKDVDYVIRDNQVLIVDEFTGRLMQGRRWSDGLHQAIEAKEGVKIENENQTLATITLQNYFRMYKKLSGMTGTADTEATEFKQIYKLDVAVIPTNLPMIRKDHADVIYKSEVAKHRAIISEINELRAKGQPVLVGTISVEKSEVISALLKKEGIHHHVLNAKQHAREADIVAQAGRKGSLTISTNMAGRGTDIVLGGNPEAMAKSEAGLPPKKATPEELEAWREKYKAAYNRWKEKCDQEKKEVLNAGGLFILGTERHESRRIDNQLRGRSGRQGDPGASRFYLSLEDDLMRIFGGVNIARFMEDDMPIEHRWISKAIENAQRKVEGHNYDIRKHLLEYDDVMNQQRNVVYSWRKEILSQKNLNEMIFSMVTEIAEAIAQDFFPNGRLKRINGQAVLDEKELNNALQIMFYTESSIKEKDIDPFNDKGLTKCIIELAKKTYNKKLITIGKETLQQIEHIVLLSTIDQLWKDHLLAMDHLREGIGLRGYGQKDPLIEYKKQAFKFFEMMMRQTTGDVVRKLFAVQVAPENYITDDGDELEMEYNVSENGELTGGFFDNKPQVALPKGPNPNRMQFNHAQVGAMGSMAMQNQNQGGGMGNPASPPSVQTSATVQGVQKVGRNQPCPCGSGKKYKKCHGT